MGTKPKLVAEQLEEKDKQIRELEDRIEDLVVILGRSKDNGEENVKRLEKQIEDLKQSIAQLENLKAKQQEQIEEVHDAKFDIF